MIEQATVLIAEKRYRRRPNRQLEIERATTGTMTFIVGRCREQAGIEPRGASQGFFLSFGATEKAASRILRGGKVQTCQMTAMLGVQPSQRGNRRLVGD